MSTLGPWLLPDECIACGAAETYKHRLTNAWRTIKGEQFLVRYHHWRCSECGVAILSDADADEVMGGLRQAYALAHPISISPDLIIRDGSASASSLICPSATALAWGEATRPTATQEKYADAHQARREVSENAGGD